MPTSRFPRFPRRPVTFETEVYRSGPDADEYTMSLGGLRFEEAQAIFDLAIALEKSRAAPARTGKLEEVRDAVRAVAQTVSTKAAKTILAAFNAMSVMELNAVDYDSVVEQCRIALLDGEAALTEPVTKTNRFSGLDLDNG